MSTSPLILLVERPFNEEGRIRFRRQR